MEKYKKINNVQLSSIHRCYCKDLNEESNRVIIWKNKNLNIPEHIRFSRMNIFLRILNSLIPFNSLLYIQINNSPDILGPFLIYTFLSFSISGIIFYKNTIVLETFNNRFLLLFCTILMHNYIFGLLLPYINMIIFRMCQISKRKYKYFICVYGYSFGIFLSTLILSFFINEIIFLFGLGIISSIYFIINNFFNLKNKNYNFCEKFLMATYVIFTFLLFLYYNNILYNNIIGKSFDIFITKISKNKKLIQSNKILNNVKIAISADDKRIYSSLVCLTSLMEHIDSHTKYFIYVITLQKFYTELKLKLDSLFEIYGNNHLNISYIFIGENEYNFAKTNDYISKTAYYRISLGSLLPNYDKILYIDVDIINFHDLSELYNIQLKNDTYIGAILNYPDYIKEINELGVPAEFEVNSGVLLFNLNAYRKYDVENKIKNFIIKKYLNHHDETAINAICYNNTEILPIKYNIQKKIYENGYKEFKKEFQFKQNEKYRYKNKELYEGYYSPVNLHFAGWFKPWDKKEKIVFLEYWWYYVFKTKFSDEIMKFYGFDIKMIKKIILKINNSSKLNVEF